MDIDRDEILQVFVAEAHEQLDTIERGVLRLENQSHDAETLAALFRAAHTLKGNAGVAQLIAVEAIAHTLEDALERLKDGTFTLDAERATLMLHAVDAVRRVIPLAIDDVHVPQQPEHA